MSHHAGFVGHPELPDGYWPYLRRPPTPRASRTATAAVATGVAVAAAVAALVVWLLASAELAWLMTSGSVLGAN